MESPLSQIDFLALSPFLILLFGALAVLLLESLSESLSKKLSFLLTLLTLITATFAVIYAPSTNNPLITPWVKFDYLSQVFSLLFLGAGILAIFLANTFFQKFHESQGEFYFLILSSIFGLFLIGKSADFLILFLGLETLSIPLYILCGYAKDWEGSRESSLKYFLTGALATAFLLYGIALIYGAVGTTQLANLLEQYNAINLRQNQVLFLAGAALITLGLSFKATIVPFQFWAPDVYEGAPSPVTAFMAVGTKIGAFAAFISIFLIALPNFTPIWNEAVALLAYPTLVYANILAIRQTQLRRFFAYSGISHAGYLLIPLAASTPDSIPSILFYLAVYGLATYGCFSVLTILDRNSQGTTVNDIQGLYKKAPFLACLFSLCLLTLAGIPPTPGFFAKLYLFKTAFEAKYYVLVFVGLLATIFSAFYYLRFIAMMYSKEPEKQDSIILSTPALLVGLFSLVGIGVVGFYPDLLIRYFV